MLVVIQTQARKKAKLTPYFDVMDFQIILLTGLVIPGACWFILGIPWAYTVWMVVLYGAWISMFKINKPAGYGSHFWKHVLRGKAWTAYGNEAPHPELSKLREADLRARGRE
jgi:hypothetical protein